ncbi:TrbC family F-type conjugative pilus assembly protein, partial [Xanthomonas perforans]
LQAATSYNADAMNAAAVKYGLKPESKKLEVEQGSGASKFRYCLHISWSMGDAAIRQALEYGLKYRESMVLSLRGPRPGEKLEPLIFAIVKLMGEVKEGSVVPNIEINPPSFTDNDVTVAPTLVVMNEQGQPIAKVAGVMNPEWVESEIEAGRRGDLGKHGQTSAIGEIDMMQAMIEKAKATDTKAMAERAKARIWQNLPMIPLPKTTVPRIRELDPGFYVTEDIPLPDGTFLARKGDYVNPLEDELMAFDDVIVIVDANDPEQVDFAAAVNSAYRSTGVITMLTDLDRSNGWDVIGRLTQRFKDQPFLLTSDVKERFRVERVPTVITVVDKKILVQEIPAESVKVKQ